MCQSTGFQKLSRDEVIRLAASINSPELWAFITMADHRQCTWDEAMQGAAVHLAQVCARHREATAARLRDMPIAEPYVMQQPHIWPLPSVDVRGI